MPKGVKVISYDKQGVGKRFKSSKKRHSWRLEIEGDKIQIDLYVSKISGKRKIVVNGDIRHQSSKSIGMLQYPFVWKDHNLNVIQQGDSYDLRIDSVSFEHMFLQARNQSEFGYEKRYIDENISKDEDGGFGSGGFERNEDFGEVPGYSEKQENYEYPPTQFNPSRAAPSNPFDECFEEPYYENDGEAVKEQELKPMHKYDQWGTLEAPANEQKPKPIGIKPPEPKRQAPLKPQTINQPPPASQNIFTAPEIKQTRTEIHGDLFENPSVPNQASKPASKPAPLPEFPQSANPFDVFDTQPNPANQNPQNFPQNPSMNPTMNYPNMPQAMQFSTGMPGNYYMPAMNQFYTANPYYYSPFMQQPK